MMNKNTQGAEGAQRWKDQKMFKYPEYVIKVNREQQVNQSEKTPIYISLLETDRGRILFDLRIWQDGQPTKYGIYVHNTEMALNILNGLKNYIAEHGEQDKRRESITDVLGYNPFEQE